MKSSPLAVVETVKPEHVERDPTWRDLIRWEFGDKLFATKDDLFQWQTELRLRIHNLTEAEILDAIRWASDTDWKCKEMTLKMLRIIIFTYRKQKLESMEFSEGAEACPYCYEGWVDYTRFNGAIVAIPCQCPAGTHVEQIAYKGQQPGQFRKFASIAVKQIQKKEKEVREWVAKYRDPKTTRADILSHVVTNVSSSMKIASQTSIPDENSDSLSTSFP